MCGLMLTLFLSGIVLGAGPCMISCGLLLISYTAATKDGIKDSLRVYFIFSLSRILVYLVLGILAGMLGEFFLYQDYQDNFSGFIYIAGGIFIILMGLLIILGKEPRFKFCRVLREKLIEKDIKSIFIFGLIVGISPCAPLLGVLSYIGLTSFSWIKGLLLSLSFALGTIVSPLIFLVVFAGFIKRFFKSEGKFFEIFQKLCGIILCLLGLHLFIATLFFNQPKF